MTPKTVFAFAMLCGLMTSGGVIVHNFSEARAQSATHMQVSHSPFPPYSEELRRNFISTDPRFRPYEELEYLSLTNHAGEIHDQREFQIIAKAHRLHLRNALYGVAAKKRVCKPTWDTTKRVVLPPKKSVAEEIVDLKESIKHPQPSGFPY